ncbi:MAG TPA: pitrilysin family protein [Bdellovibrionales bacterium]|nr:pitrilysin family protein [Bdellovibrionales bacterium]
MMSRLELPNKLTVLLARSPRAPVVTVQAWIQSGSATEPGRLKGLTHFIEHLAFRGTGKFEPGEITALAESLGGQINAFTSLDHTTFSATLPSRYLETAVELVAQLVSDARFDSAELEAERAVVLEEINSSMDVPSWEPTKLLFETAFGDHPYSVPVIGSPETVKAISRDDLVGHYRTHYRPDNMLVVVAGDFEPGAAKELIAARFERAGNGNVPLRPVTAPVPAARTRIKSGGRDMSILSLTWPLPPAGAPDARAVAAFAHVLGGGSSSRLALALRQTGLAKQAAARIFSGRLAGAFFVMTSVPTRNLNAAAGEVLETVAGALNDPPSAAETETSALRAHAEALEALETTESLAQRIAGAFLAGDSGYESGLGTDAFARLTPAELQLAARRYLTPERLSIGVISPLDAGAPALQWRERFAQFHRALKPAAAAPAAKTAARRPAQLSKARPKQPERITLPSGATLLLKHDPAIPVVNALASFRGGVRAEPAERPGTSHVVARAWARDGLEGEASRGLVRSEAIKVHGTAARDNISLSLRAPASFEAEAAVLLANALKLESFDRASVARERESLIAEYRNNSEVPLLAARQNFFAALFGDHPYARKVVGTPETVAAVSEADVTGYWSKIAHPANLTIALTGDFDRDSWVRALERAASPFTRPFSITAAAHDGPARPAVAHAPFQREQCQLIYGFKGLPAASPERFALHVLLAIFNGGSGRLAQALRASGCPVYSAKAFRHEGYDTGFVATYVACAADKVQQVFDTVSRELSEFAKSGPAAEELERARRYVSGEHEINLQSGGFVARFMAASHTYGNPFDEVSAYTERIGNVKGEDVAALARSLFGQCSVVSCAGPLAPLNRSSG